MSCILIADFRNTSNAWLKLYQQYNRIINLTFSGHSELGKNINKSRKPFLSVSDNFDTPI